MRILLALGLLAVLTGCGTVIRTTTSVVTTTVSTAADVVTAPLP